MRNPLLEETPKLDCAIESASPKSALLDPYLLGWLAQNCQNIITRTIIASVSFKLMGLYTMMLYYCDWLDKLGMDACGEK
jgi:hypothetical protein